MLNFLRKLRRKEMNQNSGRYLKYAFGEIFLVVIGILIALSINNWNEVRKENNKRQVLIQRLIFDFEDTNRIFENVVATISTNVKAVESYIHLSQLAEPPISVDSLKKLAARAFKGIYAHPTMTTYNQAISTGSISLLDDVEFLNHISAFNELRLENQGYIRIGGDNFFSGSIQKLRDLVGNLEVLGYQYYDASRQNRRSFIDEFSISNQEYLKLIKSPLVFFYFSRITYYLL